MKCIGKKVKLTPISVVQKCTLPAQSGIIDAVSFQNQ